MMRKTSAICQLLLAAWALVATPIFARLAFADTGNADIDRGIELYNDLEFEQATGVLETALGKPNLTRQELTEGYRYLALSHIALGQDDPARAAFRKLLEGNPTYQLPRTENPRALDLFDEVRRSMPELAIVQLTQTASPLRPRKGSAISVSIVVVDELKAHQRVVVYHRARGQKSYSQVIASRVGEGRYNATVSGAFVNPPALEYYVTAEAADGHALALEGSENDPMVIAVERPEGGGAVYTKWWFWTGLAALLLAGAGAGLVLASGGGNTPDGDATVTITVSPP